MPKPCENPMLQSDLGWLRNLRTGSCSAKLLRKLKTGSRPGSLLRKLKNESGSAVVEFVALALPLFVPVIIFLSHFSTLSNDEFMVRTLARESVRAYILSANDLSATLNARNTMKTGARELGLKEDRIKDLSFTVDCVGLFCITPDNKVEITITLRSQDGKRVSTATARETVSPWV
jgi:Flp pilus assembly protein TadG